MNKKIVVGISCFLLLVLLGVGIFCFSSKMRKDKIKTEEITGMVLQYKDKRVTIQDSNHVIYTFSNVKSDFSIGDQVIVEYTGILNKNQNKQSCQVMKYNSVSEDTDDYGIPTSWLDDGIFSSFYKMAYDKLKTLTLDEKIGQLLLVRYPDSNQIELLKKYGFSGYLFFEKDFKDKTSASVKGEISNLQKNSSIPLLTAVDEEGGNVVRVSSNPKLVTEKFKSPSELYSLGGFDLIQEDTVSKSQILSNLGLNLNLAPVVDVSTNSNDYMYERTLKENTSLTSTYAKKVIESSKGTGVSYTLKHFPGYGNNSDTHTGSSVDSRSYEEIVANDLPPFKSGIDAGAEAVLVSHNIVDSIDSNNPASLSMDIHNLLRGDLGFTGIVITDDLAMGAVSSIDNVAVKALLAGNDLLITTDYQGSFDSIKKAVEEGQLSEEHINKLAFRVLAWKYYKLLFLHQK